MSRATPRPSEGYTGISLPKTGPRKMGVDAENQTSVVTMLNETMEALASLHGDGTGVRPTYLPVNGMWMRTNSTSGDKELCCYDGANDHVMLTLFAGGGYRVGPAVTYSYEEWDTGLQWNDGLTIRTIWGKLLNMGALPNTGAKDVAHGITGLDFFISVTGTAIIPSTGVNITLPMVYTTLSSMVGIYPSTTRTGIRLITGGDMSAYTNATATLFYVKQ